VTSDQLYIWKGYEPNITFNANEVIGIPTFPYDLEREYFVPGTRFALSHPAEWKYRQIHITQGFYVKWYAGRLFVIQAEIAAKGERQFFQLYRVRIRIPAVTRRIEYA
jgi:hypothetical protein